MTLRRAYAAWLGSALLVTTALVHLTGFLTIPASPPIIDTSTFYEAALRPLWLFASIHWLLIATVCVFAARSRGSDARIVLLACGIVILTDAATLYWFIGPFVGVWLLAGAGAAIMGAITGSGSPTQVKARQD